jgi:hypothetical protein
MKFKLAFVIQQTCKDVTLKKDDKCEQVWAILSKVFAFSYAKIIVIWAYGVKNSRMNEVVLLFLWGNVVGLCKGNC